MKQILQQFKGQSIRIVQIDGEPHFILADLCRVLGMANPSVVATRLDEDERAKFNLGPSNDAWAVNESGLYAVILRSDKPVAKEFRKWITNEVLPAIRQTGGYSVQPAPALDFGPLQQVINMTAQAINASEQKVLAEVDTRIERLMAEQPINNAQAYEIQQLIRELAIRMGGKPFHFAQAWRNLKDKFQVPTYKALQSSKFDDAARFIRDLTAAYEGRRPLLGADL